MVSSSEFNRQMRQAQRAAEREFKRQVDKVNRENQRAVDAYNRKVAAHNKREIDRVNNANQRAVDDHNRKAEAHNRNVLADLNRRLQASAPSVTYRPAEQDLVERVAGAITFDDGLEYDVFISYARIDGEAPAVQRVASG